MTSDPKPPAVKYVEKTNWEPVGLSFCTKALAHEVQIPPPIWDWKAFTTGRSFEATVPVI